MSNFASFVTGILVGFFLTMSYVGYELGLKRDPCELNITKAEKCVMIYIPESIIEKAKNQ